MDASEIRQSKRLKLCNDPESSAAPHSAYGEPVSLNLGLKVFLSHSGMDKNFVRRLYSKICRFYDGIKVAFFDEESLPKGKAINMEKSILEKARNSVLGVLVLTEDFFMHTQNPMLELEAFVAGNVDLLPLFLKMSVEEFKQKEQWNKWEKQWEKWAAADDKLVIDKWRSYLPAVTRFNGVEFCKIAPHLAPHDREDLYIDEVVRQVACIIGPAVPMCGKDVYGKVRLCQIIDDMYKECSSKRSSPSDCTAAGIASTPSSLGHGENSGSYAYTMVGIHGFSGLGKTTLSKCLCDFYFGNMKGNVCYIDLGLSSETGAGSRMRHVLSRLDRRYCTDIYSHQLCDSQVKNLLEERLSSMQDPVFLAIDNIPPETESREEALIYLRCNFPKGSKIFITSRTERTLRQLIDLIHHSCSFSTVIEYMPKLEYEEARDIFKHGIPDLHNFSCSSKLTAVEENIQRNVAAVVCMCTIFSNKWYHPLMLKSLAGFVKWDELLPKLDWKRRLAKLASEGIVHKDDALEQVYKLFDITYKLMTGEERKIFLDLALYYSATMERRKDYYEWIQILHLTHIFKERDLDKVLLRLHNYCFVEKECYNIIIIHDLMVEFGKHKAQRDISISDGYLVSEGNGVLPDVLPSTARYVSISRCPKNQLRKLDLKNVKGVTVLHLLDNAGLEEVVLSRTSSAHLRSMIVSVPAGTALRCIVNKKNWGRSLKLLEIEGNFQFCFQSASKGSLTLPNAGMDPGSTFLGGCRYLCNLTLHSLLHDCAHIMDLDLTPCAHLKLISVKHMPGLKSIRGPESSSHLQQVSIEGLPHLEELAFTVPAHFGRFQIRNCASLQQISLNCTTLSTCHAGYNFMYIDGAMVIEDCPLLANVDGLSQFVADGKRVYYFNMRGSAHQLFHMFRPEIFAGMQVKDAPIDFFRCKAVVTDLRIYGAQGLGNVGFLSLRDAQHIGPLISALFQAQPSTLKCLEVQCQQASDGSCGCACDKNPPNFCGLPRVADSYEFFPYLTPEFYYCCQQVRDLSSLSEWTSLRKLTLRGCTSVEVWPDFAAMTALGWLDLSNTSLREWPAGVHLLPHLQCLDLRDCPQLPAKRLMLKAIPPWDRQTKSSYLALPLRLCQWAFASNLREDLRKRTKDRCTGASALGGISKELAAIFDRWCPNSTKEGQILRPILELISEVWFCDEEQQHITEILTELLSSESFLSLQLFSTCTPKQYWCDWDDYMTEFLIGGCSFCHTRAVIGVLGIYTALVGGYQASSTHFHRALPDNHLQDHTIFFFHCVMGSLIQSMSNLSEYYSYTQINPWIIDCKEGVEFWERALRSRAREAGLEVEEGSTDSDELQELRERAVETLCQWAERTVGGVLLLNDDYSRMTAHGLTSENIFTS